MRSTILRYLIIPTIISVTVLNVSAQDYKKNKPSTSNVNGNEYIIPGTIVVKLKPQYRNLTNDLKTLKGYPGLSEVFKKYNVEKFAKAFPHRTGPGQPKKNTHSRTELQKIPDLSLIHVLHFNPDIPVFELINKLNASGLVEYAEPMYNAKIQYMPNDPYSQPDSLGYYHLYRINAFKAWDIEKGDPNVVIGILDTGTDFTQEDLIDNVAFNTAETPGDGLDNDGDGYIDNYYGWDTGDNDNDPTFDVLDHGVRVQGACTATPDNGKGLVGTGYYCKSLPIKISNQYGSLNGGYAAIEYAATHGVKVMNLSWGGFSGYSQYSQDIINDAAILYDVLIIAAGGNTEIEGDIYPGSYDNVFSCSGLDTAYSPMYDTIYERRKTFSQIQFPGAGQTYSFKIDISALEGGASTYPGNQYFGFGGSSQVSPTVAGAAALVRSKYPQLSAVQAGELLRVSGDILDTFDITLPESRYKTGRKLNMYKALTNIGTPSVRIKSTTITGGHGGSYYSGDTLTISHDFFNYLSKTNNLSIKMICSNNKATVVNAVSYVGTIDSLNSKKNLANPFKIVINQNTGPNEIVDLVLIMTDPSTNYYDFQGFKISVNPPWLDLDTNKVKISITSTGKVGFNDTYSGTEGLGLKYLNNQLLYESGLMIGVSTTKVSDCIHTAYPGVDQEFKSKKSVSYVNPSSKDMESHSVFNDSLATSILGIEIDQRSYSWINSPNDKFIIVEYNITNKSSNTYDSLFAGIYTDWDIANSNFNRADFDAARKVAYTYSTQSGTKVGGVALLTDNIPSCYSFEYPVPSGTIDAYNNYSTSRKFNSMANGVARKQAGMSSSSGAEVSQTIAAKIYNFAPGDKETVAFAYIAADNVIDLADVAQNARNKFVSIKKGPVPVTPSYTICRKDTVDINVAPTNGNKFAFYTTPPPASPVYTGSNYTFTDIYTADTVYIANVDSLFNSDLKTVYIKKDNMDLAFYPSTDTIVISEGGSLLLVNQSSGATSISWDLGDGNTATGNSVTHTYNTDGFYDIKLSGISPLSCYDTLKRVLKVLNITDINQSLNGTALKFYPNPVSGILNIDFANGNVPNDLSIELLNTLGNTVYSSNSGASVTSFDMTGYSAGVYYLKLKSGGNVLTKMIIKN